MLCGSRPKYKNVYVYINIFLCTLLLTYNLLNLRVREQVPHVPYDIARDHHGKSDNGCHIPFEKMTSYDTIVVLNVVNTGRAFKTGWI